MPCPFCKDLLHQFDEVCEKCGFPIGKRILTVNNSYVNEDDLRILGFRESLISKLETTCREYETGAMR